MSCRTASFQTKACRGSYVLKVPLDYGGWPLEILKCLVVMLLLPPTKASKNKNVLEIRIQANSFVVGLDGLVVLLLQIPFLSMLKIEHCIIYRGARLD